MDAQELRNLQEAYLEVVENQQLDELSVNKMHAYINKAEKDRDRLNKKWDQGTATPKERKKVFDREEGEARASKKIRQKTGKDSFRLNALDKLKSAITKEQVDIYDIILSHLLDEGYAETPEAAEVIMVNMSEGWREEIMEGMTMKDFKANRRKLQRKEASDDAKKRGHVDKFTGKPYGTEEAASRRKDIHKPEKAPEREARRKFAENPD